MALFIVVGFFAIGVAVPANHNEVWSTATAVVIISVLILVGLAAWPILFAPFDTDTPVLRAAFAATDVFGDWNHPFLPYLFNRPTTWLSLEPWALRIVPLAFLSAETVLMMLAARRDGGMIAAALGGVWFSSEIRRRHGLFDLGDWDVGGTFLVLLLLAVQHREELGPRRVTALCALMAAGVMSSWLMIVVSGVLVGCLGIEAIRGRLSARVFTAPGLVFALLAVFSLRVFTMGAGQPVQVSGEELWQQMYHELPLERQISMLLPVGLGIVWLVKNRSALAQRFVGFCLIAVPSATYVAYERSHVNGGYYIGLVTPMLLYAASVGTVRAVEGVLDWLVNASGGSKRPLAVTSARTFVVLLLAAATVGRLEAGEMGIGAEHLTLLAHETLSNELPIYTNSPDLPRLLAFERARAGEGQIGDTIQPAPPDLAQRFHLLAPAACAPNDSSSGPFYLVYLNTGERELRRKCVEQLGARCSDISASVKRNDRSNWVLRCNAP
ncbi:MAG: hypothetical protein HY270_16725 [Deltaproteobacteria bacterium]|nr:hypothetical protein [Deltaproteobacteria bacterium]